MIAGEAVVLLLAYRVLVNKQGHPYGLAATF